MHYDPCQRTFDCEPTLTDSEVLEFCREGHLLLRGVVPDEINQRTCAWIDGDIPANPSYIPDGLTEADLDRIRFTHEPTSIFLEDWFIEHVLLNPQLAGAMRSLLGPNIGLPVLASHHRAECPMEAQALAPRRRPHLWPGGALFGGLLLSAGHARGTGADRVGAWLAHPTWWSPRQKKKGACFAMARPAPLGFTIRALCTAAANPPPRGCAGCLSTITGARHLPSAIGSSRRTLISRARITAGTARRATTLTCSTGSAARAISSALSAARLGLGRPKIRSGRRMVLTPRKATSPIGGGTIRMGMRVD